MFARDILESRFKAFHSSRCQGQDCVSIITEDGASMHTHELRDMKTSKLIHRKGLEHMRTANGRNKRKTAVRGGMPRRSMKTTSAETSCQMVPQHLSREVGSGVAGF